MPPITDWPIEERPREKLLKRGSNALSDAELLAIFLRTGIRGKTAVDLSRDLLNEFGSLRALFNADITRFCQAPGLGPTKYTQLQAVLEMGRRYLKESMQRGDTLSNPKDTHNYLIARLRDYSYEVFGCLFLDNRHRVICFEELFQGTINSASVHPREVVKRVLTHNAAAVIIAHNHPSGVAEPSHADKVITQRLKEALALIDVRLLDHLVIGDNKAVSFVERGLI
ncbi:MAG: DNA repair protein RadC [Gammaproteobacteria bacterium]|nr:DNA repair protein RadC [Gammaproteobacteria bacterium]